MLDWAIEREQRMRNEHSHLDIFIKILFKLNDKIYIHDYVHVFIDIIIRIYGHRHVHVTYIVSNL